MAHTNETVNYHLSQFVGTDIPNPLVDYNGDMVKIDEAIKGVADASAGYASDIADIEIQNGSETLTTTAQTLSGAVNELDSEVGDINTRLTTAEGKITADEGTLATAVSNISTLSGKVSAVETKVGTAVLTTTASDCSGAINELDADVTAIKAQNGSETLVTTAQTLSGAINEIATAGGASADDISYDNTTSGLTATNVQGAIDELSAGGILPSGAMVKVSTGQTLTTTVSTTFSAAVTAIESNINQLIASLADDEAIEIVGCSAPNSRAFVAQQAKMFKNTDTFSEMFFISANPAGASLNVDAICLRTSGNNSYYDRLTASGTTVTQTDVSGVTNAGNFVIFYDKYKVIS